MNFAWFASDRDGHVALFRAGQWGAVPEAAAGSEDPSEILDEIGRLAPATEPILDLDGRLAPGAEVVPHREPEGDVLREILMFLRSCDPAERAKFGGVLLRSTTGVAVAFPSLPRAVSERLHAAGSCIGCFWHARGGPDAAGSGLFVYEHLTDARGSGPYGRTRLPAEPWKLSDVPEALGKEIEGMRFASLCFLETAHIQPIEHGPCRSPTGSYLSIAGGGMRPVPGREDEYLEDLAEVEGLSSESASGRSRGRSRLLGAAAVLIPLLAAAALVWLALR